MTWATAGALAFAYASAGFSAEPAEPAAGAPRHGLALYDDLKYPAGFAHFDYVRPDTPRGGTLRMSVEGGFDSLNPFITRGDPAWRAEIVYDTLMASSDDEPFSTYGLVAETVELAPDRSAVTYNLRPEARWHDGRPVTAEDVAFSLRILKEKGAPKYRFYYKDIASAEVLGPRRVRFNLGGAGSNRELPVIAGQLPVLPKHYWETRDFAATTVEPPLGGGAYRIRNLEPNRYVVFERVTNYWARDLNVKIGYDNFDTIRMDYYRDAVVELEAFKAGAIDWMLEMSAKNWATAYDTPEARAGLLVRDDIPNRRTAGMQGLVFNTQRPVFKDRRVRQAFALAFDFEWANRKLMYGAYTRCRSYFGNSELEATGLPEGDELALLRELKAKFPADVPDEALTRAYAPPSTGSWTNEVEHKAAVRRNLVEARRLLAEAGWRVRPSDLRLVHPDQRDGRGVELPCEVEILLVQPTFERIVLPFTVALERLGIRANVRSVDSAIYINRINAFDYDLLVFGWQQSHSPGNEQLDFFGTSSSDQPGTFNLARIRNPAIDDAIGRLLTAKDRATLVMRTRVLDRLLQWGWYCIPQWYLPSDRVVHWDRFGRPAPPPMEGLDNFRLWWSDPAKEASFAARRAAMKAAGDR